MKTVKIVILTALMGIASQAVARTDDEAYNLALAQINAITPDAFTFQTIVEANPNIITMTPSLLELAWWRQAPGASNKIAPTNIRGLKGLSDIITYLNSLSSTQSK